MRELMRIGVSVLDGESSLVSIINKMWGTDCRHQQSKLGLTSSDICKGYATLRLPRAEYFQVRNEVFIERH